MRLSQAFVARDQMNKQAVLAKLVADVNAAFQEGAWQWQEHLVAVFGEHEARRLLEMLERPV